MKLNAFIGKLYRLFIFMFFILLSQSIFSEEVKPQEGSGTSDSPYLIGTAGELAWFRTQVNSGKSTINAKLTSDIDLSSECGEGKSWIPIGNSSKKYSGNFDGCGYEVKNLYIDTAASYQGLFGYAEGAEIINVGVSGSITSSGNYVGGICGYNKSKITNCCNFASIVAKNYIGGISGISKFGSFISCYNVGKIKATSTNSSTYIGAIGGEESPTKAQTFHCYYLENSAPKEANATLKSLEEFTSGEVAFLLNSSEEIHWFQKLGQDSFPVLKRADDDSNIVYKVEVTKCDGSSDGNAFSNGSVGIVADHVWNGSECTVCSAKRYGGVFVSSDGSEAIIDGSSKESVNIPNDINVEHVVLNRTFTLTDDNMAYSTIVLPFTTLKNNVHNATFYKLNNLVRKDNKWEVHVKEEGDTIKANIPYLVQVRDTNVIVFDDADYTLKKTEYSSIIVTSEETGTWCMVPTFESVAWTTGHEDLGRVYGFTAKATDDFKVGQFAKAGAGASIRPLRAYLMKMQTTPLTRSISSAPGDDVLPSSLSVVIDDEETTEMETIVPIENDAKIDVWLDVFGRVVSKESLVRGIYIKNNQKVIIR